MQFMFEHFLRRYKYEIYAGKLSNLKRLPWYELLAMAMTFASFAIAIVSIFSGATKAAFIGMMIAYILMVLYLILDNRRIKIDRDNLLTRYKENRLEPLISLLKSESFDLFSTQKIDWLLSCCNELLKPCEKPSSGLSDYFLKYMFPFITMFFGFAIKLASLEDGLAVVAVICLVLLLAYWLQRMIAPIVDDFMNPDKYVLRFLKSELEYIKTML